MVKKFRMPPPILPARPEEERLWVSFDDPKERINEVFDKSGLLPLHAAVCKRFGPYLQKKLESVERVENLDPQALNSLSSACTGMALLYIGRRVGNFVVRFGDDEDGRQLNDTGVLISGCLNVLRRTLGEKQATQIFRRLEKITDEVLAQQFGRSK
jgi:hypothetical protein